MPPFRARAFFQHNINSPEDIIAAGLDTLTRLLVIIFLVFILIFFKLQVGIFRSTLYPLIVPLLLELQYLAKKQ